MHAPIHLAISWLIGHKSAERRDRRLVAWAGVVPDLDALTLLGGVGTYVSYHHVLTHGVLAAVGMTLVFTTVARERLKVLVLSLVSFHVHLLCDLVGSGAEGQPWPIVYFYPFSYKEIVSPYGWDLASPANAMIWLAAVAASLWIGVRRGMTFGETFLSARADTAVVNTVQKVLSRKLN